MRKPILGDPDGSARRTLALAVVLVGLLPATAHAYIDPGTGSFVLQGILAAIVGAGVAIKLFWGKIAALFGRKPPAEDDDLDE